MKEIVALIIAIVRVIVAIILTYWTIKYAMSAVDFFKTYSANAVIAVALKNPPHLLYRF